MTSKPQFDSISHFLQSGDFDYRIFDMGRKVTPITKDDFKAIESQQAPYPFPFQKKAFIGLLFWPKNDDVKQATIWFLQFPIDEMGLLKQDARDGFLISLLEQTGKNILAKQQGEEFQDELAESPYAFKPPPDRLAVFHAFSTKILDQPPSKYYQFAHDYLTGNAGYEQWQFLGLQGVADIIARLDEDENEALLTQAINKLPDVPLEIFSQMLEHAQFGGDLTEALLKRLYTELAKKDPNAKLVAALIRGISGSRNAELRKKAISKVLDSALLSPNNTDSVEVIVAISGRNWQDLRDEKLLFKFIEQLSKQNQQVFNAVLTDLMMLPDMRPKIMEVTHNPKRTEELGKRLELFMQEIKNNVS